jgi:hypothetical protein
MIPNAMTASGPYEELWSFLKSVDHAVQRALTCEGTLVLSQLDKERLLSFATFLERGLSQDARRSVPPTDLLPFLRSDEPSYSSSMDVRRQVASIPRFESWQKARHVGIDKKIQQLIHSTRQFVSSSHKELFAKDAPREEFEIVRDIVRTWLAQTETALSY